MVHCSTLYMYMYIARNFQRATELLCMSTIPQEDASADPEEAGNRFQDEHQGDIGGAVGVRGDPGCHGDGEGRQGGDSHLRRATSLHWKKTLHNKSRTGGKLSKKFQKTCGIHVCFVSIVLRCRRLNAGL